MAVGQHVLVATAGVATAGLIPGVDAWVLLSAFLGASVYVISSSEMEMWKRFLYLPIATLLGYIAAAELAKRVGVSEVLAGAVCGAVIIAVLLWLINFVQTGGLTGLFKRKS